MQRKYVGGKSAARDLIDDAKQSGLSTVVRRCEPGRAPALPLPTGHPRSFEDFPKHAAAFYTH
jgi:hypothetical protein